jgi:hypothetical protein
MMHTREAEDLEIIARCLRRARLIAGGLFAVSLLATAAAAWLWQAGLFGKGQESQLFGAVMVGSLLVIDAKLGILFGRRAAIEASSVYRLLQNHPGQVLWTFPTVLRTSVLGTDIEAEHIIIVCTGDARIERIRGVRKKDLPSVLPAVRRLTPQAYYGLNENNRRRYKMATGFDVK